MIAATQRSVADQFSAEGLSVFPTETEAVTALHQFLAHRELMARTRARKTARADASPPPVSSKATTMLNEADSLALLAARGIPVVPHRLCRSRAEAIAAFAAIGGPVVIKGCSADIAAQAELGLVKLGVRTREEAGECRAQMDVIIRRHGARFDGVIVAAMAGGRREIMIGAHRDPVFGPVVAVGDGGKYVEIFRDTRAAAAAVRQERCRRGARAVADRAAACGRPRRAADGYRCARAMPWCRSVNLMLDARVPRREPRPSSGSASSSAQQWLCGRGRRRCFRVSHHPSRTHAGDDEHRRHRQHLRERFRGCPFGGFLHAYLPRPGRELIVA